MTLHSHNEFQACGKVVIFKVCTVEIFKSVGRVEEWHTLEEIYSIILGIKHTHVHAHARTPETDIMLTRLCNANANFMAVKPSIGWLYCVYTPTIYVLSEIVSCLKIVIFYSGEVKVHCIGLLRFCPDLRLAYTEEGTIGYY